MLQQICETVQTTPELHRISETPIISLYVDKLIDSMNKVYARTFERQCRVVEIKKK